MKVLSVVIGLALIYFVASLMTLKVGRVEYGTGIEAYMQAQ